MSSDVTADPHEISIVVPVYKGELTLRSLVDEILAVTEMTLSPAGIPWRVSEVLLVHDNGPDDSASVIRALAAEFDFVRPVWLSRNFGQHAATLAGMASSGSEWIATIDEDGQHDPADIGVLLDAAVANDAPLVYAKPITTKPHGALRNASSRGAKALMSGLADGQKTSDFQSFRLILGEIGRSVAAYAGSGVYLDIAFGWVASRAVTADVHFRDEGERVSGYSGRKLLSHFWKLVLSSGTRALRVVALVGATFAAIGVILAIVFVVQWFLGADLPAGWTSLMTVILLTSGALLISLGMVAEYLGMAVNMAMGKPPYLIVSDPADGPLGRRKKLG
ncbi:glycosyltransferase [Microbacterium sp. 179-I 3D4 NHS]|uniref:glycosyltransferase n=1 Tax=Microbacterium sp. 179-I 3D4 NHS TaxID=3142381 RepID=UPI0039A06E99